MKVNESVFTSFKNILPNIFLLCYNKIRRTQIMNVDEKIEGLNPEGQGTDPNDIDLINEVKKNKRKHSSKRRF
jgi:hypothetical protein